MSLVFEQNALFSHMIHTYSHGIQAPILLEVSESEKTK